MVSRDGCGDGVATGPVPTLGTAWFLAGSSYPRDNEVEQALRQRLAPAFGAWIGQADVLARAGTPFGTPSSTGLPAFELKTGPRKRQIESLLAAEAPGPTVLIGRSSGARVMTEVAIRRPVQAVICLGYPFHVPGGPLDPRRFAHLAALRVPTLILQGESDGYGTPARARELAPSPFVSVLPLDTDHQLRLTAEGWDATCRAILDFCRGAAVAPP